MEGGGAEQLEEEVSGQDRSVKRVRKGTTSMTDKDLVYVLTRKQFIKGAAGTAGVLAVGSLLEGCGTPAPPATIAPSPTEPVTMTPTPVPAEPVTITVFGLTEHVDVIKKDQELFEEAHPNIKLAFNTGDYDSVRDMAATLLASDDSPDVAFMWVDAVIYPILLAGNLMLPLDDLYESEGWKEVLDAEIIDRFTEDDGHLYAVAWKRVWAPVIYYNIRAFEEAGIDPIQMANPFPADLEEWYAWADALRSAGYEPLSVPGRTNWVLQHTHDHLLAHNTSDEQFDALLSNWQPGSSDQYKYTDPEVVEVHEEMVKWVNMGICAEGFMARDYEASRALFATGKAAMLQDGSWAASPDGLYAEVPEDMPFGWLNYPPMRAGETPRLGMYFGDALIVASKAKHPDEAKELLRFEMTLEAQERMARGGGWFPTRNDVSEEALKVSGDDVYSIAKATELLGSFTLYGDHVPAQISDLCRRLLEEEFALIKTPEEACAEIQAAYEELRAGG